MTIYGVKIRLSGDAKSIADGEGELRNRLESVFRKKSGEVFPIRM